MSLSKQIAKQFRDIYFGGNWTCSNLKDNLADVTWQQATIQVYSFNTIAILVYHMNYFVSVVTKVLQGEPLIGKDSESFDCPTISSQEDWENLLEKTWADAENCAVLIQNLPESKILEIFSEEKYGNYFRNIVGIIEHNHYHLGQIVLIKKILLHNAENTVV